MISLDLQTFTYDDGAGLADILLTVDAGERVLICGDSGSGKSTLARLLAGQFDPSQGQRFVGSLTVAGERLEFGGSGSDPRIDPAAWAAHVGYVGQRANAQLSMVCGTVAEEIAFGLANRGVPSKRMHQVVARTAERVGLTDLLDRDPRRLSGGELQRVCIAAAVVGEPGLLVLDEPFNGLDAAGQREIGMLLEGLRGDGTAVVQFEPILPSDLESVSRILVLAGGSVVFSGAGPVHGVELREYGMDVGSPATAEHVPLPSGTGVEPVVELTNLEFSYGKEPVLSVAKLDLRAGEAVAVTGPNGSGKSTLLQHLNGLLRPSAGSVRVNGQDVRGKPTGSLAGKMGFLFQDSDQQLFERTALREASYGPRAHGHPAKAAWELALTALADVGLVEMVQVHPHDLSFTQRRLLALASLIATGPGIWVLDEPTVGLDLHGREMLAGLIRRQVRAGGTVVMATHDAGFSHSVCNRGVRLHAGTVADSWAY